MTRDKKLNLLIDGIIERLQKSGGVSTYFEQLIRCYTSQPQHVLNYISYVDKNHLFDNSKLPSKCNISNQTYRLGERYRSCVISPQLHNFDVFHSTYYRLPSISIPVVTTVHDFTYELYVKGPKNWIHCWQKHKAILNSNKIICVSNNTAIDLMKFCHVDENIIHVIHNGVSDTYFHKKDTSEFSNNVIFVGSRAGYKNFKVAVESVSEIKDLTLSIVGGGIVTPAEKALLEFYLPNRYDILGYVPEQQLNDIYNNAYCLLYPSSYEGFGIPVIEAMKAGCPVVAVNASSIPEVAGDAAILVDSPTSSEISFALKSLCNQNERNKYISRGIIQAKKFSWEKSFNETFKVYNEI